MHDKHLYVDRTIGGSANYEFVGPCVRIYFEAPN